MQVIDSCNGNVIAFAIAVIKDLLCQRLGDHVYSFPVCGAERRIVCASPSQTASYCVSEHVLFKHSATSQSLIPSSANPDTTLFQTNFSRSLYLNVDKHRPPKRRC